MKRRAFSRTAALLALFALVALIVLFHATDSLDLAILQALRQPGLPDRAAFPHWLVWSAREVTWAGAGAVRGPIAAAGALLLFLAARPRSAVALLVAWSGGGLLVEALKAWVNRPRPAPIYRLTHVAEASFPSGHATGAMILYPLLALAIVTVAGRGGRRIGAGIGVGFAILIGITRVILGVHWPSDVLGGWLLGGAVALLASPAFSDAPAGGARDRAPGPPPSPGPAR